MRRRGLLRAAAGALAAVGAAAAALAVLPEAALAHGLVGKQDLPIPAWLFGWAAAVALLLSFVALGALWREPKLEDERLRPLPAGLGRALTAPALEAVCGAIGVALLVAVVWSGLAGVQNSTVNLAPTFVYVLFWVGLVPVQVLFGDVFRAFNPWRAVGRAVGWAVARAAREEPPRPLPYPERLGRWPAAIGILAFAWLELVSTESQSPDAIALATIAYSILTWIGMALYGVERWSDRGEAFSVYFNLYSRLSPVARRGREIGLRRPLSGLASLEPLPGTVGLLAVMIGSTSFDGFSEGTAWADITPGLAEWFASLGLSPPRAIEASFTVGLVGAALVVGAFYWLGVAGARTAGGSRDVRELGRRFVHTLVPIAVVYVAAHYMTLLLYQGQAVSYLAVDPLGEDDTLRRSIDYGVIGATAAWYWQVGFVVAGHVAALASAHDRAIALYRDARAATRSQVWLLAVMVGFTSLALWLLSEANQ